MLILKLAIPTPLYGLFDYIAPDNFSEKDFTPGVRAKVPWRKGVLIGVVLEVTSVSDVPIKKLKKIIEIIDAEPLFTESVLKLILFAQEYYHYPIGEVFSAALPNLLKREKNDKKITSKPKPHFEILPDIPPVLNIAQENIINSILKSIQEKNITKPFLLFGVTGSGKTEVYLQIIDEMIKHNKQALVLVPEIGLTPQMLFRFQARFPVCIVILHSGISDKARGEGWLKAKSGEAKIIIGTRSAIFVPLKNPGIIIVDEEHDMSFKQQEGFRYSARDLSIMRAKLEEIPVILGSATPSLESLHNVDAHRYVLLNLPERAGVAVHPEFKIIDLRKQKNFSSLLIESMRGHLEKNNQVLLFLNRRGFSPTLICHQCGWVARCLKCDANMNLHQTPLHLQCHHCGTIKSVDKVCPECQENALYPLGAGTERVEEKLAQLFPHINIIRIDRDSTRKKGSLEKKLETIHEGEAAILVGTQMLAKGHHFKDVTLVVILNADTGLFSSDFRGTERTAQLILQVAGRSGRAEKPGEVILQTYHPEHVLLNTLITHGYADFAKEALKERESVGWPPYAFLCLIRAEAIKSTYALNFLNVIKNILQSYGAADFSILGPIPAPLQKKAGKYRAHLLLQCNNRMLLKSVLDKLIHYLTHKDTKKKEILRRVRWSLDVDPLEFL